MSWFEIIGSLATAGAFYVIAYQAYQTKQQLKQAKEQLELTRTQMELVEKELQYNFRPWIYRENFSEYWPLKVRFDPNKRIIEVNLKFRNYGKLAPVSKTGFINFDSKYFTDPKDKGAGLNITHGMFPNQTVPIYFSQSDERLFNEIINRREVYTSILLEYQYSVDEKTIRLGKYQGIFRVKLSVTDEGSVFSEYDTMQESIDDPMA